MIVLVRPALDGAALSQRRGVPESRSLKQPDQRPRQPVTLAPPTLAGAAVSPFQEALHPAPSRS